MRAKPPEPAGGNDGGEHDSDDDAEVEDEQGGDNQPAPEGVAMNKGADAAQAASAAAEAASVHAKPSEDKGPTTKKSAAEEVKAMRSSLGNTLFVSAGVMAKDNIRSQVAIILEVTRPIYEAHAWEAHNIRKPANAKEYYQDSAIGDFMMTMEACAKVFLNMPVLKTMGFITDFAKGLNVKKLTVTSDIVQAQTTNAFHMLNMFCRTLFHRITSMLYRTHGLGQTALLGSNNDEVYDACACDMRRDYRISMDILHKGSGQSLYVLGLIKGSIFRTRVVRDIMLALTVPHSAMSYDDVRERVHQFLGIAYSGWGQTEIVEDVFKHMRER